MKTGVRRRTAWNEKGMVLVTAILLLAVIVILGTTAYLQISGNLKIGSNYRQAKRAFFEAEAGIQYVLKKIEEDVGTLFFLTTPSAAGQTVTLPAYAAPSGFTFTAPSTLTDLGDSKYRFRVAGQASGNASATLEVDIIAVRRSLLDFGLFGDGTVDLKAESHMYSYDSRVTPNPDPTAFPGASTGLCDVGSNTQINAYMDTYIDGDTALGESSAGVQGTWNPSGVPIVTGEEGLTVDRVDPDPLGAVGGALATQFSTVITTNDNDLVPELQGGNTVIDLSGTMTLVGKSGGANYYITSLTLRNGSTLVIDATNGPVNVFLSGTLDAEEGDLEAKNGSQINNNALPTDFNLYSDSTQRIVFKHGSDFKGMVYAPYAPVEIKNSGNIYGLLWGNTVDIKNSGEFYFDTAFQTKFPSNKYRFTQIAWRDVRATVQ